MSKALLLSLAAAFVSAQAGANLDFARRTFEEVGARGQLSGGAYAQISRNLIQAGYPQTAAYFFIRALQSGDRSAIRNVLLDTQAITAHVGPDLLRKYLIRHTKYEDYDPINRSTYLYSLGKEALLINRADQSIGYLNSIPPQSPIYPYALQMRGTALSLSGKLNESLVDFQACQDKASLIKRIPGYSGSAIGKERTKLLEREERDLEARCIAGEARVLYQMNRFEEAEKRWDRIPKRSVVWTDILFEQAWNAYAKEEYNRTLGKLVSYKSPALQFVFNSEVDVLAAQSYLSLCLYEDAGKVIDDFNRRYSRVGDEIKRYVEGTGSNLAAFFEFGKTALRSPLSTRDDRVRMANRFVRGPYFQNLVISETEIMRENAAIQNITRGSGFAQFVSRVLGFRQKSVRALGGAFVKNSLLDYHSALIADYEKISFVKLEILRRSKERLLTKKPSGEERSRGNKEPRRRGDQYYWTFNGEFWNDELGDYVFGLESECQGGTDS